MGVIEAKKEGTTLTGVEFQTHKYQTAYPDSLPAFLVDGALPFGYESTGKETRFTSGLRSGSPTSRSVFAFHRPETLRRWQNDYRGRNRGVRDPGRAALAPRSRRHRACGPPRRQAIRKLEESTA